MTTISDPAGNTVGVRDGKVTAENASSSTGKGLFSGTGPGNALGSALPNDNAMPLLAAPVAWVGQWLAACLVLSAGSSARL